MKSRKTIFLYLFTFWLVFVTCLVRSEILVDSTFLPRFIALNLLLLVTFFTGIRKKIFPGSTSYVILFLLFYLWSLASCLWSIAPSEALMQSQMVFSGFTVFLIIWALRKTYPYFGIIFTRILLISLFFSFGLSFYKMASIPWYDPYRISSICANNNLYSGFLLLCLPFVLSGYSQQKGFWKYLSVAAGILSAFFIIIIQSRAALLGILAGFVLLLIISVIKYSGIYTRKNIITGSLSLIILFLAVLVFYSSLDTTRKNYFLSKVLVWNYLRSHESLEAENSRKRLEAMQGDLKHIPEFYYAEDYYENANLRYIFWEKSFCLIRSHPFCGIGAGNWRLAVPSCKKPVNPEHTIKNYTYSQPHNEWIGILSELGITGFILALLVFFIPPGKILLQMFSSRRAPPFSLAVDACFLVGFCLFACFDFPFRRMEHIVVLFSLMAFLTAGCPTPDTIVKHSERISSALSLFIMIPLLLLSLFTGVARTYGEYYTLKIFHEEHKNDMEVIRDCRKAENIFYHITPNTLPIAWFEGVAQYRTGNLDAASDGFRRAIRYTPYEVRVLNDYGITLFNQHKIIEGKSLLLKSIDLDPYFDDAKFNLSAIYYTLGQKDSAVYYLDRCRESEKKKEWLDEIKRKK
ncbi:MAG: O-antigen ligase family protein [Bacteroidota bacterium]|nr:O-antigen ligase family protein [Bacteroidota bacterium]